jgi:hypothetical protein
MTDWEAARHGRDDGMAAAEANAPRGWNELVDDYLRRYARLHEFFHVDEFWEWALPLGLPEPHNGRAIGPAIKKVARDGVLVATHTSAPSVRSHLSGKPVWRCATWQGNPTGTFRDFAVAS